MLARYAWHVMTLKGRLAVQVAPQVYGAAKLVYTTKTPGFELMHEPYDAHTNLPIKIIDNRSCN